MAVLTVWGRKTSSNVQAVMWCIGELGIACERLDVGHRFGGTDTPAFHALNPNRTIPVLRDGSDEALWESAAILRYLAGRYGREPFWPSEGPERARVDKWAEWAKVNVSLNFAGPIFWQLVRVAAAERDLSAIEGAVSKLDAILDIAEAQLERQDFLAGEAFTLADIQLGHVLYRYFDLPIRRQEHPALKDYYDRLQTRRPFVEHVMIPYDELRVAG